MSIDHSVLKELVPLPVLALYLLSKRYPICDRVASYVFYAGVVFLPVYTFIYYLSGTNLFQLLDHGWRTYTTPVTYIVYVLSAYSVSIAKTRHSSYSLALAYHLALFTGYIYEIPRYLHLQGIQGLIRYNYMSPFIVCYAILAGPVSLWLLTRKPYKINTPILAVTILIYLGYCYIYLYHYPLLHNMRYNTLYSYNGVVLPWISFYRLPAMLLTWGTLCGITQHV